jgi:3-oxoacyl-[acyl-carrier-protein] synthase II
MTSHRVVITGIGAVTPTGLTAEETWESIKAGRSGIGRISRFDPTGFETQIAGECAEYEVEKYVDRKEAKRMDRFTRLAAGAARMALEDSALELTDENRPEIGVMIGSGIGGIDTWWECHRKMFDGGPDRVSPFTIPMLICNMPSGQVSMLLGLGGPNSCPVTACATSTHAVGDAYEIIRRGDAPAMLAGGTEAPVTPMAVAAFCAMKAMSTRNDEPERASRPFDVDRDGFVMSEGSTVLVLEELERARARGARIYAEVIGYGMTGDAYHITSPSPGHAGLVRCIQMAMRKAGITPEEIDYINAHGTSTGPNDKNEAQAIKTALGEHAHKVAVSSTKSMTGHLLGAAGALEAMICALAIRDQTAPPTINLDNPDPDCDLDFVPHVARPLPIRTALSNNSGFGGHNATLILRRFDA